MRMNPDFSACSSHYTKLQPVRGCATCNRIALEREIVIKTVDVLLAAGYALATNQGDGPDCNVPKVPTRDRETILKELMEVDDEFLGVFDKDSNDEYHSMPFGWVRFVYGNDGYDVISDYTVNLEEVLGPVNKLAREMAGDE